MVERRRTTTWLTWVAAGLIIGAVECVLAIAFAAFVFGRAALVRDLPAGIGLYLGAAVLTLGFLAWRAGPRGVVGSVQDAPAAVLAGVASIVAAKAAELAHTAQISGLTGYDPPDVFLTVVTAGILVTVLCGIVFAVIGRFRLGGLIRFVPYPVVGGFLAGTGWLLFKGGVNAAAGMQVKLRNLGQLFEFQLSHLLPALAFGVILADRGPRDQAAPRDPGGDRDRAGGVRDRDGRDRLLDRGGPRGRVAAVRRVRDDAAVGVPDVQGARRRRLGVRARVVGRDRGRGVRGHARDPVQHLRHRARLGPGPRHEQGAPRRRRLERRVGSARGDPRLSRALADRPRGAHARGRAGRRA